MGHREHAPVGLGEHSVIETPHHKGKVPLRLPTPLRHEMEVLLAIDRELSFYRRRAGQVFWIGLLVEALLLVGKQRIEILAEWTWQHASLSTLFFVAIAAAGIALGSEYRRRIHILKDGRLGLLKAIGYENLYPTRRQQWLSEIEVLYVSLGFLSSMGILLSWLRVYPERWLLILSLVLGSGIGPAFAWWRAYRSKRLLRSESVLEEANADSSLGGPPRQT